MKSPTQCPSVRVLNELVDGKLIEPELSSHASHLEECEHCQNTVRTLFPSDSLVKTLRNDAGQQETMSEKISQDLIDALKRIPAMDSDAKLSADGLRRDSGLSLDELGLSFLSPPEGQDEIGRLGHYRVLKVLGRGGMGVVFLAEDPKLGRKVALKVMLPKIASIPAARDRFLREAKAAASLKNDHIVTVYQVDEINGVPFLAMELLQGESLEDALRAGRRFSVSETIRIARDIARGLSDAHEKGLVHRDVKPGNLWLEQVVEGGLRVKILDFGLARLEVEDIHITEFGTIVGTPAFMAPEQARADRPVDAKADLFSLGCVLYVLCTGDIPFKAETTVGVLMALALNTPVAPNQKNESVPAEISQLTMQLLEKDPTKRPQSARDVVERLRKIEKTIDAATITGVAAETLLGVSKPVIETSAAGTQPVRKSFGRGLKVATAVIIAGLAFFAGEMFFWKTPDGKIIRIESNDPSIMLAFGTGELKVTGAYDQPVTLMPGKVDLKISKPQPDGTDFEFETDKFVVRKGDQIVLKIEVLDSEIRIVQDGKSVVDSKPMPSGESLNLKGIADIERRAAMWVLLAGGEVVIETLVDATQGSTDMTPIVVKAMAELPAKPFAVTEISFRNTRPVDAAGFVHLRNLKYLNSITVNGDGVGAALDDAAFENLQSCTRLKYLHTKGCNISDKTLEYLKDLPELISFEIGNRSGTTGITDAGLATLKTFPALQKLLLGGNNSNITNEGLYHFGGFKDLRELGLTIRGLSDEGLVHLGDIKTLTGLDIVTTGASDATMKRLSELPNLTELSISYTQVTDLGLDSLQALKGLRSLSVMYTSVTKEAIERFHNTVPECRIRYGTDDAVVTIDSPGPIDWTPQQIGTEQFASVSEAMRRANPGFDGTMVPQFDNGQIVAMQIKTDRVTDIRPLRDLKHLRSLQMVSDQSSNQGITDLSPLQGLPLKELFIHNNRRVSDLSPLRGMPLQDFRIYGSPVTDLSPLSGLPLNTLTVWAWAGSDLSPLKGMQIRELNIGGNQKPMDLTPLAGLPLEYFCCNLSEVSDLSPLSGMPLKFLLCENTRVADLSPVRDAKLLEFVGGGNLITDFSVLRVMPLTWAKFDIVPERDLGILRDIKTLVRINDQRAANFLKEFSDDLKSHSASPAYTNNIGMTFVQIPKGKAWQTRISGQDGTSVQSEATIEQDFFLGMYEVTQEEWVKVMGSNPSWFTRNADGADAVKLLPEDVLKRLPVERVCWTDCQQFLKKLNELDSTPGWEYRLPTEAEWQFACRGGSMTDQSQADFSFYTAAKSNELTSNDANIQHEFGWNRPCRVGLFPPNSLGLHDMHGNVWEWCNDGPQGRTPAARFIHGGGWNDGTDRCRASTVLQPTEPWTYYDLGLRVARVPTP